MGIPVFGIQGWVSFNSRRALRAITFNSRRAGIEVQNKGFRGSDEYSTTSAATDRVVDCTTSAATDRVVD